MEQTKNSEQILTYIENIAIRFSMTFRLPRRISFKITTRLILPQDFFDEIVSENKYKTCAYGTYNTFCIHPNIII